MLKKIKWCSRGLFHVTLFLSPLILFSQTKIIDSLRNELKKYPGDSIAVTIFSNLGNEYFAYDTLQSSHYLEKAHTLAKKLKWDYAFGEYYFIKGMCKQLAGQNEQAHALFDSAIFCFNSTIQAKRPSKEIADARLFIATCLGQKADVLLKRGKSEDAIDTFVAALEAWKASDQPRKQEAVATYYTKISSVYYGLKQFDNALKYDKLALQIFYSEQNDESYAWTCLYVSDDFNAMGRIDSCEAYISKAKPLVEKLNHHRLNVLYYNKIAQLNSKKKNHREAIVFYRKAIEEAKITDSKYQILSNQHMVGVSYAGLGDYVAARKVLLEALSMAIAGSYTTDEIDILQELVDVEEKTSHIQAAYTYLTRVVKLRDSINVERSKKAIAEIENKYQGAEKEKEIIRLTAGSKIQALSLKQKSVLNYFLLAALAAVLIVGFLVYLNTRHRQSLIKQQDKLQKQQIRELEKDKQLVAADSMFRGQEEERSRMAKDLHDGLGGMLSGVKLSLGAMKGNIILSEDNSRLFAKVLDQLDYSIHEMRRVAHNMMPEALVNLGLQQAIRDYCDGLSESILLEFKLQFHGLENRLEAATEVIIYRIIQELLNNVVKHARATTVLIQVMRDMRHLTITIEDNGVGFDTTQSFPKSDGLKNIRSRVDYLRGEFDVRSSAGGTSVHIDLTV